MELRGIESQLGELDPIHTWHFRHNMESAVLLLQLLGKLHPLAFQGFHFLIDGIELLIEIV